MISGCPGQPSTPTINEKKCPNCGSPIELFSTDSEMNCPNCGFTVYNDTLSCVRWCQYAKECVGEEMYEHMMKIAEEQDKRKEEANA